MNIKPIALFLIGLAAIAIAFLLSNPLSIVYSLQSPLSPPGVAEVSFITPQELKGALAEVKRYNLRPSMLIREFNASDQVYVEGFNIEAGDWRNVREIRSHYWQSHSVMLADMRQSLLQMQEKRQPLDQESSTAWQTFADTIQQASANTLKIESCWRNNTCPEVKISRLLVSGSRDQLERLVAESSLVARVELREQPIEREPTPTPPTVSPLPTPTASGESFEMNMQSVQQTSSTATSSTLGWLPRRGNIDIRPSSTPGERYVIQTIYWDSPSRVAGFDEDSAYEHDFFLNDSDTSQYGQGTYWDDSDGLDQVPDVSHWSSNLPSAYLDTRSGDPGFIKAFTIGSADGNAIQSGTWYNSYIRTVNGDANMDNGLLQAQLGYRFPSWCYTTWCVFGSDHVDIYPEYKVDPIPGIFSWEFHELYLPFITRQ